jgi:hypothetical protein
MSGATQDAAARIGRGPGTPVPWPHAGPCSPEPEPGHVERPRTKSASVSAVERSAAHPRRPRSARHEAVDDALPGAEWSPWWAPHRPGVVDRVVPTVDSVRDPSGPQTGPALWTRVGPTRALLIGSEWAPQREYLSPHCGESHSSHRGGATRRAHGHARTARFCARHTDTRDVGTR